MNKKDNLNRASEAAALTTIKLGGAESIPSINQRASFFLSIKELLPFLFLIKSNASNNSPVAVYDS